MCYRFLTILRANQHKLKYGEVTGDSGKPEEWFLLGRYSCFYSFTGVVIQAFDPCTQEPCKKSAVYFVITGRSGGRLIRNSSVCAAEHSFAQNTRYSYFQSGVLRCWKSPNSPKQPSVELYCEQPNLYGLNPGTTCEFHLL